MRDVSEMNGHSASGVPGRSKTHSRSICFSVAYSAGHGCSASSCAIVSGVIGVAGSLLRSTSRVAMATTTVYRSCTLCEATCGVAIEVEGDRVVSVRGDDADPFSKGYICPKGTALADLHHDPDRLRQPMRARRRRPGARSAGTRRSTSSPTRLREIRARTASDAIAVYQGNPTRPQPRPPDLRPAAAAHARHEATCTRRRRSISCRTCSRRCTMFGNQLLMPVPDIDRTRPVHLPRRESARVERQHHDRARRARRGSRRSAIAAAR